MKITLSAKEAAEKVGISYWLILEMAKAGRIPNIRAGKRVLFRLESLEKWMDEQEKMSIVQGENKNGYGSLRKIDI